MREMVSSFDSKVNLGVLLMDGMVARSKAIADLWSLLMIKDYQ